MSKHMKHIGLLALCGATLAASSGCYTTKFGKETVAPKLEERQWFTLFGLVPLSDVAGKECDNGVQYAESQLSVTDALIDFGLSLVAGLVATHECSNSSATDYGSCVTVGAALGPALLASRSVAYQCR